jgi:methionyl-tRNA formyltransferase
VEITGVVVLGTGRLACACLEACLRLGSSVECIEPAASPFSALKSLCRRREVSYGTNLAREEISEGLLRRTRPTLVVSAYNAFLFPRAVLEHEPLRIVNYHDALLPRHRGRNAPAWTIFEMDECTGVTWHDVGTEIDRGAVIVQSGFSVPPDITAIELTRRLLELGGRTFVSVLPALLDGSAAASPLGPDPGTYHRASDVPNDGLLDLGWDVDKAYAFLRSVDYGRLPVFPVPRVLWRGREIAILEYGRPEVDARRDAGRIVEAGKGWLSLRDDRKVLRVRTEE